MLALNKFEYARVKDNNFSYLRTLFYRKGRKKAKVPFFVCFLTTPPTLNPSPTS